MLRELTYNNKVLKYSLSGDKLSYNYDGVDNIPIEKLTPTLHNNIVSFIREQDAELTAIEEKKRKELEAKQIAAFNEAADNWEAELKKKPLIIAAQVEVKVTRAHETHLLPGRCVTLTLPESRIRGEITHNVWKRGSWHSSPTDKVWDAEFDFKHTRHSDLDKAIAKLLEKMAEKKAQLMLEQKKKMNEQEKKDKMKAFCVANDFKFDEHYHCAESFGRHSRRESYYTYNARRDNAVCSIRIDEKTNEVIITSITLTQQSQEQYLKLMRGE